MSGYQRLEGFVSFARGGREFGLRRGGLLGEVCVSRKVWVDDGIDGLGLICRYGFRIDAVCEDVWGRGRRGWCRRLVGL